MYGSHEDPYVYSGTDTLKNTQNIRDPKTLAAVELEVVNVRSRAGIPLGNFDVKHYCQIHHHLFQDIYDWAGEYRTVRIAKGGNWFCYPEHIRPQMQSVFEELKLKGYLNDLTEKAFVESAAKTLSDLNAIHPFRDGNGRAQLFFLSLISDQGGHPLKLERINPQAFLDAMIKSFSGHMGPLEKVIAGLL